MHLLHERHLLDHDQRGELHGVDRLLARHLREHAGIDLEQSGVHNMRLGNVHDRGESEFVPLRQRLRRGDRADLPGYRDESSGMPRVPCRNLLRRRLHPPR
jgi:hypothetical protein